MTAPTSAIAHEVVVTNGLVKKLHGDIVRMMQEQKRLADSMLGTLCDSMTGSEIARALDIGRDLISPRMPELLRLGVVARNTRRRCTVTGHSCQTWKLTGNAPVTPPKRYWMKCDHCKGHGRIEIFASEKAR